MRLLLIPLIVTVANAATITFRVVAPGATDVQVSVNGQLTKLSASDPDVPYFVGQAEANDQDKYQYVVSGKSEPFQRTLEAGRTVTRNDFFNRPVTYANIPELPWPIADNPQWTRGGDEPPMFDTNYIPTIFMNGDPTEMNNLIKNVPADLYSTKFTFVGPEEVLVYKNCSFGIHGAGKKHNNDKQSWRWILPEGQYIYNRNYIKLRHMEEDPTQMREKLYADVLQAMGVYANQANIVRLYINGEGFGTFNMLDDIPQYSYIRAMFYNGKPPQQMGPLYDGASGASFMYSSNKDDYSSWIPNEKSPEDYEAIDPLCATLNKTDFSNDASVAKLSDMFDTDSFMRFMVMEYLAGHWDGYWMEQTNDGAYRDPTNNNMWYYLGQDYDATFGVNLDQPRTFVETSYTKFPEMFPGGVMINGLLKNPAMRTRFESYLKNTTAVLFNNYTLTNRVLEYQKFLLPDLEWDRSIKQQSPGIHFGWTFDQVTANLWTGTKAPGQKPGGAEWGLLEWVVAKSNAVAKEFNIEIVQHPVQGPQQHQQQQPQGGNKVTNSEAPSPPDASVAPQGEADDEDSKPSGSAKSASNVWALPLALLASLFIYVSYP
ncbi:hypothetical protein RO3G_11882 [Lichtheimia corymbifera JMRC:FSU:9682]|uniref:Coth protein-domain-containing protein n=1 Tax=Lichtheimia corymbifera JMRC:FSU:9682 TaxID=1263082 RepID=A0A068S3T7_9FUNG|nr:hypothetical protein RO3G_11882 [Lichtheimia corymbifera JMRC:FSU:9682]